jgi:hypothetical protein
MQDPRHLYLGRVAILTVAMVLVPSMARAQFSSRICDRLGTSICEAEGYPIDCDPLTMDQAPAPIESYDIPNDYVPPSNPQPPTSTVPSSSGFGDLNLISRSSPGDSFAAALAPGTYIDNAAISNMFRFRFDAANNNTLPDRAEFFYGQAGLLGNQATGLLAPETSVDYQEFRPYFERAVTNNFSLFAETAVRLINPDVNDNTAGFGDLITGFKASLYECNGKYLTGQLKVYAPTGDADRGLGTGHASLEPGLLYLGQMNDRFVLQSEFRAWIPLSDSQVTGRGNYSGTVLRYGIGAGYDLLVLDNRCNRRRLTSTFEAVGWTITDGLALDSTNAAQGPQLIDVDGDTIANLKSGLRYTSGAQSIATSYGVAVTGDQWYRDILRVEYRYLF